MNHVTACGYLDLTSPVQVVPAITSTYKVLMPFIRNTQSIEAGKEVILKWKPTPKKNQKREAERTVFDQFKAAQNKGKMAKRIHENSASV